MFTGFFATHRACGEVLLKNVAENYLCKFLALRMQESVRQLHTSELCLVGSEVQFIPSKLPLQSSLNPL